MRPNSKKTVLLFTVGVVTGALALEPVRSAAAPDSAGLPAGVPAAAVAASEAQAARAAEVLSGTVGLAPAAVPSPRLVRSASAQARTGADRPDELAEDPSSD